MALSQSDRIAISKKIVEIPLQNASADGTKAELTKLKAKFTLQDNANKSIIENDQNPLINAYQSEIARYDGDVRTTLVEQDFLDAANKIKNNSFFPNDPQLPLPNLPSGLWVYFLPYSFTKAIGKKFDESNNTDTKEQDLIDAVFSAILTVESFSDPTRSTGQKCIEGTCSLPQYENELDCTNNGGTWTANETIVTDNDMQAAGTALINAVQAWEDFLNGTFALVPTIDTNPTRSAQNDSSRADITNAISEIDSWQALPDYDTSHGQTTCAGFNSLDVNTLNQTKFRADSIQILSNEITARQNFITTRLAQINGHLGSVIQSTVDGSVSSVSGFYGARFRFIDLRLNLIAGSLSNLKGLERGEDAQEQLKASNDNAAAAYDSIMTAVAFRSPGTNTKSVHVMDATGFGVGNSVYVVSDTQVELAATIEQISGNRVVLDINIPEKYRHTEFARLYKTL